MFGKPVAPDVPGLDRFQGTTFHSADWPDDHDLSNERVAVIGSAASAVQLIPEIAPVVASLTVYQRTPNWVSPKDDDPYTDDELAAFAADPDALQASRDEVFSTIDPNLTFADTERRALYESYGRRNIDLVEDDELRAQTHPGRAVRIEATAGVEPLLPHVQPAARRARDRCDHRGDRTRDRHRRRHDA